MYFRKIWALGRLDEYKRFRVLLLEQYTFEEICSILDQLDRMLEERNQIRSTAESLRELFKPKEDYFYLIQKLGRPGESEDTGKQILNELAYMGKQINGMVSQGSGSQKEQIQRLEQENYGLNLKLQNQERDNRSLKEQLESQKRDNRSLKEQIEGQERGNRSLKSQLESQEGDNRSLKEQLESQKRDNSDLKGQLERQKQENSRLEKQLQSRGQQDLGLKEQLQGKENEIYKLKEKLRDKELENNNLRKQQLQLQSSVPEKRRLEQDVQSEKEKNITQQKEIESLRQELQKAQKRFQRQQSEIESYHQELQKAEERFQRQQKEMESLRQELQAAKERKAEPKPQLIPTVPEPENIFSLQANQDKYLASPGNIEEAVSRITDTHILEEYFAQFSDDDSYKKIFQHFKKKLRKKVDKLDLEDDVEDIVNALLSVMEEELFKKVMVAVYRGLKAGRPGAGKEMLKAVNQYLEQAGIYSRTDIQVGDVMKESDYDDMEFIVDKVTAGKRHKEIVEIELYPYYMNYIDEDGEKKKAHTQGKMVVIA